ncbi:MAG TPA: hypothetical protein VFD59_14305 [Nocardioidaceae bacterium]|nr:hypothetical protein [Nocardioidaceae bacterium]
MTRVVVTATLAGLLLASCSDDGAAEPSASESPSVTSTVNVPEDASLTEGGEELGFGDTATVVFEPNQQRGTVLELSVDKVALGSLGDFSGFILDAATKSSTPYYVDVSVENLGEGDVGGFAVPLYGVDSKDTLLQASAFTTSFKKCPSQPLPEKFEGGDSFDSCLVYLAAKNRELEAVSFRPVQEFDPIAWKGDISDPAKPKKTKKADKPKKPKAGQNP